MTIVLVANRVSMINPPKLVEGMGVQPNFPLQSQLFENQTNGLDLEEGDWIKENGTRVFSGAS